MMTEEQPLQEVAPNHQKLYEDTVSRCQGMIDTMTDINERMSTVEEQEEVRLQMIILGRAMVDAGSMCLGMAANLTQECVELMAKCYTESFVERSLENAQVSQEKPG